MLIYLIVSQRICRPWSWYLELRRDSLCLGVRQGNIVIICIVEELFYSLSSYIFSPHSLASLWRWQCGNSISSHQRFCIFFLFFLFQHSICHSLTHSLAHSLTYTRHFPFRTLQVVSTTSLRSFPTAWRAWLAACSLSIRWTASPFPRYHYCCYRYCCHNRWLLLLLLLLLFGEAWLAACSLSIRWTVSLFPRYHYCCYRYCCY